MVVTLNLDDEQMARLERVCRTTGVDASVAVSDALTQYEETLEGDFRHHFTPEQTAAIEAGLKDAEEGRTTSNEAVFAEIRAKYGW